MYLLLDWGNSYLKCVSLPTLESKLLAQSQVERFTEFAQLETKLTDIEIALIASVRCQAQNQELQRFFESHQIKAYFARTSTEACGIHCAYEDYSRLGIDRWLALIGAEGLTKTLADEGVGVWDFGTAITLDLCRQKQHLGGHILPGENLMHQSLFSTGRVNPESQNYKFDDKLSVGTNTTDCVNFAIEAAIQAYVKSTMEQLSAETHIKHWWFTGGGARLLSQNLTKQLKNITIHYHPALVFEGLLRLFTSSESSQSFTEYAP